MPDFEVRNVRFIDSRSNGCGFKSRLIQNTRWKWSIKKPGQDRFLHPILV
jgi:hypothetical protein